MIGLQKMSFRDFMGYIDEVRNDYKLKIISEKEKDRLEEEVKREYPNWTYGINPNIDPEML